MEARECLVQDHLLKGIEDSYIFFVFNSDLVFRRGVTDGASKEPTRRRHLRVGGPGLENSTTGASLGSQVGSWSSGDAGRHRLFGRAGLASEAPQEASR